MSKMKTQPAPSAEQTEILFSPTQYTAFPQVIRLDGDELLMAFRQAPVCPKEIRHTHPRSVITVIRSYDLGRTWDLDNAGQLGAGGGSEFAPLYLGGGKVTGAMAWLEVAPEHESERAGLPYENQHEYPVRTPGSFWVRSHNFGFTWRPDQVTMIGPDSQACGAPILTDEGALLCPVYQMIGDDQAMSSVLYRSDDLGDSWSRPVVIASDKSTGEFCGPALIEVEPGRILAMHRIERTDEYFWLNRSTDGGRTWSEPTPTNILSGACPRLLKLRDGRLVLTFGRRFKPYGIRAAISEDGGQTWGDTQYILRDGPNWDLGYTSSIELDDGQIFTATYMQRFGTTGIVGTFWQAP
ncbi:MAG: hypothetical protein CMJ85_06255 [Planctomycetes bacterium]|nr:hypothetical protein [Planctomycetota bacterium]